MTRRWLFPALIVVVVAALLAAAGAWWIWRPWALTWGATAQEIARAMPGDGLVQDATFRATRAVTIEATREQIWPWIVQIGYRRAGFYSYDRLDNDGIPSATRILPEYQDLETGDAIPMGRGVAARVIELDAPSSMLLVFEGEGEWGGSAWAWGLYPVDQTRTRLVTRLSVATSSPLSQVLLDLGEIVMMRKCMLGIKRRAETRPGAGS
jgi:hypothetical protein